MSSCTMTKFQSIRVSPDEIEQLRAIAKQLDVPKHRLLRIAVKLILMNPEVVKLLLKMESWEMSNPQKSQVQQELFPCCTVR